MQGLTGQNYQGEKVQLLNGESNAAASQNRRRPPCRTTSEASGYYYSSSSSGQSPSASPMTPELLRSDSYNSATSIEPVSPATPSDFQFSGFQSPYYTSYYSNHADYANYDDHGSARSKRPSTVSYRERSTSYDTVPASPLLPGTEKPGAEKPARRYPCRFRESHNCEKTFTTSGHASRHSKIHTAEKAVACTYEGCPKKFTRADNMKQHLDTHKDKPSRNSEDRNSSTTRTHASRGSARPSSRRESDSGTFRSSMVIRGHAPGGGLEALAMAATSARHRS